MVGIPAYKILGDDKLPVEQDIKELKGSKTTSKLFNEKSPSKLYEFYIRKCNLLKSLYEGDSLDFLDVSLHKRCKNIEHATRELILKCELQ
jgi:hypothetical protein